MVDFLDCLFVVIMDDCGVEVGVMMIIVFIDLLDDFFVLFMFEIDVNVGWFVVGFGDKVFKDYCVDFGVD